MAAVLGSQLVFKAGNTVGLVVSVLAAGASWMVLAQQPGGPAFGVLTADADAAVAVVVAAPAGAPAVGAKVSMFQARNNPQIQPTMWRVENYCTNAAFAGVTLAILANIDDPAHKVFALSTQLVPAA